MHAEPQKTQALKLPAAMPVRTLSVEITEGSDRGARWEGDQGTFGTAADHGNPFDEDYDGEPLTKPGQAFDGSKAG